ncbi:MAG: formyltransferase family protein [Candidatus Thermoplasmatota archaeon]|nr:formyltransferase family protein [Candidatus Thermoplasmatota archaeon]
MPYKLGWFSTGRDKAARDLLTVIKKGVDSKELNVELVFVFSNRAQGEAKESDLFFKLVKSYNLELVQFSSKQFKPELWSANRPRWRIEYDREVMRLLAKYEVDLILLAGYMLIVGPELCRKYKLINLHPAAPLGPTGTWQEVIWELIRTKAQETGIIIHLVTEILDRGPVVAYCTFPIKGKGFNKLWGEKDKTKLFKKIREEGVKRELPLLFHTIKELASRRIELRAGGVYAKGKLYAQGYCMNELIERTICS